MEVKLIVLGIGFEGGRLCGIRIKDEYSDDGDKNNHRGKNDELYKNPEAVPLMDHKEARGCCVSKGQRQHHQRRIGEGGGGKS